MTLQTPLKRIYHTFQCYEGSGSNWMLAKSETPGNLGNFEDVQFPNNEVQTFPVAHFQEHGYPIVLEFIDLTKRVLVMAEYHYESNLMDVKSAVVSLGGGVGNLHRICAYLQTRLRDFGVTEFDTGDARRQPPINTTWQYGSMYLRLDDLHMALEYYAQTATAPGGGWLLWTSKGNIDKQRHRGLMLEQLLTELLLRNGGIYLLLGTRDVGNEGHLGRCVTDPKSRKQFSIEVTCRCEEARMFGKSIKIQKRIGTFALALDTINNCLFEAICAHFRGRIDGGSQTASIIYSGNEIFETYTYFPSVSL